jgi:hypothetical protein
MNVPVLSSRSSGAPARARDRETRRVRILALVQAGWSYADIGREERLSRERVRQIVAQALNDGAADGNLDHARVQIARLEPALRLAARGVADGDLSAIDRLLRVLERLDKYSAVAGVEDARYEGAHERLMAKINAAAQRVPPVEAEKEAREERGEEAPDDEDEEAEASENAPSGDRRP